MTTVERIKSICSERGIPMAKLERDCDFSNGYINSLKKGTLPNDRLTKVADYLGISASYLATGRNIADEYYFDDEAAKIAQAIFENKQLKLLFDTAKDIDAEDIMLVHAMLKAIKKKDSEEK